MPSQQQNYTSPLKTALIVISLILGSYFLFSDGLNLEASRSIKALWNLGHVLYFLALTYLFLKLPFIKKLNYFSIMFWVLTGAISIGILIEVLQYGTERETDLLDVAHDALGSLIVLAFLQPIAPKTHQKLTYFKHFVLLLCLISLWPFTIALWDETHARLQFPILSNFTSSLEINRWSGTAGFSIQPVSKELSDTLKITFNTQNYSGIGLTYFEHDWRQFKQLGLEFYNPNDKPLNITLRIHDKQHIEHYDYSDRYNQSLIIKPGLNTINISFNTIKSAPKTRLMDLEHIFNIRIFSTKFKKPEILYLNSIYLTL